MNEEISDQLLAVVKRIDNAHEDSVWSVVWAKVLQACYCICSSLTCLFRARLSVVLLMRPWKFGKYNMPKLKLFADLKYYFDKLFFGHPFSYFLIFFYFFFFLLSSSFEGVARISRKNKPLKGINGELYRWGLIHHRTVSNLNLWVMIISRRPCTDLVTSSMDSQIKIWDLQKSSLVRNIEAFPVETWAVGWSRDGASIHFFPLIFLCLTFSIAIF